MNSVYDFYNRSINQNLSLVGEVIYFKGRPSYPFVVVEWDTYSARHNYNQGIGLLFITNVCVSQQRPYFNVGVKSPDDWDYGFTAWNRVEIRPRIIAWLVRYCKNTRPASHLDLFKKLGQEFDLHDPL